MAPIPPWLASSAYVVYMTAYVLAAIIFILILCQHLVSIERLVQINPRINVEKLKQQNNRGWWIMGGLVLFASLGLHGLSLTH